MFFLIFVAKTTKQKDNDQNGILDCQQLKRLRNTDH